VWAVRTSQKTYHVSATKPNRLMLFEETVAVYCENRKKHRYTVCGQNAEFLILMVHTTTFQFERVKIKFPNTKQTDSQTRHSLSLEATDCYRGAERMSGTLFHCCPLSITKRQTTPVQWPSQLLYELCLSLRTETAVSPSDALAFFAISFTSVRPHPCSPSVAIWHLALWSRAGRDCSCCRDSPLDVHPSER
jgi:hypothetical protein